MLQAEVQEYFAQSRLLIGSLLVENERETTSVSLGDFAHLRIPGYFAHLLQHMKMKENDNSENSMIRNNPSLV